MLHVYERKQNVHKKRYPQTHVIQKAAPPFMWQPSKDYLLLRGAFFACLDQTKKMHLDRDIDEVMLERVDTTGLHIVREEDLDGTSVQDLS